MQFGFLQEVAWLKDTTIKPLGIGVLIVAYFYLRGGDVRGWILSLPCYKINVFNQFPFCYISWSNLALFLSLFKKQKLFLKAFTILPPIKPPPLNPQAKIISLQKRKDILDFSFYHMIKCTINIRKVFIFYKLFSKISKYIPTKNINKFGVIPHPEHQQ